ncbi:hypothetical protein [Micromonospora sp. CPCC 206061]|uniref:hypothetical protein n=1 Tax=Micromonospora sp. CPCC 206061 TaxID=3122410 RepID=UPI002FF28775
MTESADGLTSVLAVTPHGGGTGRPVLVVDFAAFAATGTVCDLLAADCAGHAVHRIDPVTDLGRTGATPSLTALAHGYATRVADLRPAAVVGTCSTATLALMIAANTGGTGAAVPVLLVDPTWVTTDVVQAELATVRRNLGADLTLAAPDPPTLPAIIDVLQRDAVAALGDEAESVAGLLVRRYRSWFGFLHATMDTSPPPPTGAVALIHSADRPPDIPPGWPDGAVDVHRIDVAAAEIPRSETTRARITALLAQYS